MSAVEKAALDWWLAREILSGTPAGTKRHAKLARIFAAAEERLAVAVGEVRA